ncbi:hypothetical protein RJ639_027567 [Escallonia herrerae]|uniref:Uncharacterized protein n=1 Tax=Escallonia herrerae TaxID=1293975 RepID=A0AA89BG73_9ASTE|nr:hypothetical protein RJ639_027567 [Escallonia herrerae]
MYEDDRHRTSATMRHDFDPAYVAYVLDSIKLLRRQRIDFKKNLSDGVDTTEFAELLGSRLVCNDSMHWVTFHSASLMPYGPHDKCSSRQHYKAGENHAAKPAQNENVP